MKRLFILSAVFTMLFTEARAQGQYTYYTAPHAYLYSPFNDGSNCVGFNIGSLYGGTDCFEGWRNTSKGTPDVYPNTTVPDGVHMLGAHHTWASEPLPAGGNTTSICEGIYHPYNFQNGYSYNIKVGITTLDRIATNGTHITGTDVAIQIWGINNLANYNMIPLIPPFDNPAFNPNYLTTPGNPAPLYQRVLLGEYIVNSTSAASTGPNGAFPTGGYILNKQWSFTTAQFTSNIYDEIMITAHDYTTVVGPTNRARLIVDYIEVCPNVGGDIVYDKNWPNNPILPLTTDEYSITAGDPDPSISVIPGALGIAVDIFSNTIFRARYTNLIPNFIAAPEVNYYFLVEGKDEGCPQTGYPYPSSLSKPGKSTKDDITIVDEIFLQSSYPDPTTQKRKQYQNLHNPIHNLSIHPNPSTGIVTVLMPQTGSYTIRVMNIVGSTVYEGKMEGEQRKQIQLDQHLPPGNYTIHINGDGLRHIEKLVITK